MDIYVAESKSDAQNVRGRMAGYRGISADALIIVEVDSTVEKMQKYGDLGFTDLIIGNRPFF